MSQTQHASMSQMMHDCTLDCTLAGTIRQRQRLGFRVQDLGFRVQGLGFGDSLRHYGWRERRGVSVSLEGKEGGFPYYYYTPLAEGKEGVLPRRRSV